MGLEPLGLELVARSDRARKPALVLPRRRHDVVVNERDRHREVALRQNLEARNRRVLRLIFSRKRHIWSPL